MALPYPVENYSPNPISEPRWNPRYVAYARANGRTPDEQKALEPGNCGFICWINERWAAYRAEHGLELRAPADHERFDAWLASTTAPPAPPAPPAPFQPVPVPPRPRKWTDKTITKGEAENERLRTAIEKILAETDKATNIHERVGAIEWIAREALDPASAWATTEEACDARR